jgi:hypothetical protein
MKMKNIGLKITSFGLIGKKEVKRSEFIQDNFYKKRNFKITVNPNLPNW